MDTATQTNACGCCEGTQRLTPEAIVNRPGLDAIAYRAGTHATFLETMKARLSTMEVTVPVLDAAPYQPPTRTVRPLTGLTTRRADDPAIALLDGWAIVGDVLTFYQERIANEGYLRTATERRSVLELARLVGYALRPGVAASTYLAYTIEATHADPVLIPAFARAQSVPLGPGEAPQSFETAEPLEARANWNALKPRMTRPQTVASITNLLSLADVEVGDPLHLDPHVYLKGISSNLKPNDVLIVDLGPDPDDPNAPRALYTVRVKTVTPEPIAGRTLVQLHPWLFSEADARAAFVARNASSDYVALWRGILEQFQHEAPSGETASNVVSMLKGWLDETQPDISREKLSALLEHALAKLQEVFDKTTLNQTVLRPWLLGIIAALLALLAQMKSDESGSDPDHGSPGEGEGNGGGDSASAKPIPPATQVRQLMDQLAQPASVPPATRFDVTRKLGTAFPAPDDDSGEDRIDLTLARVGGRLGRAFPMNGLRRQLVAADASVQFIAATNANVGSKLVASLPNVESATTAPTPQVFALRAKAAPFGHNAPPRTITEQGQPLKYKEWMFNQPLGDDTVKLHDTRVMYLDADYNIDPESWIVLEKAGALTALQLDPGSVTHVSAAGYGLSGPSTRLELPAPADTPNAPSPFWDEATFLEVRSTVVYVQSEPLELAEEPIDTPIGAAIDEDAEQPNGAPAGRAASVATLDDFDVVLDGVYYDLKIGRWAVVVGERVSTQVSLAGVRDAELVLLDDVQHYVDPKLPGDTTHTYVKFARPLAFQYKRDTVTIYGNVVRATHGESRDEVLGSGDGSKALQMFGLRQPPLTYVSAPNPAGAESTLRVYVNDVEWHEVDALAGLAPTDRKFITRTDDDSKTTVIFGNGDQGARLPTGVENVRAMYRNGIGKAGNVKAGQISLLSTRPLGAKGVINPLLASGGADKETRDQARKNAPLAVMALERLVSVQDYADFARTFAGVAKASARRLAHHGREVVHVTIAGVEDAPIEKSSDLYRNLGRALRRFGDPDQPVRVDTRELKLLVMSANVRILQDYLWEKVAPNIRAALLDVFSFERRELGQDALLSEAVSIIQAVEGVDYVDVDVFGGVDEKQANDEGERLPLTPEEVSAAVQKILNESQAKAQPRVQVNLADFSGGAILPAQLAFLSPAVPDTLILNQIT